MTNEIIPFPPTDYDNMTLIIVCAFTALHGMQTRSYYEISVRLSVCLSVKRVHCDKTEESNV